MIKPRNLAILMQRLADLVSTSRYDPTRHMCFVSYHDADFSEVESFIRQFGGEFIPRCVGVTAQDRFVNSIGHEYIRSQIRHGHLGDSTVTIVLLGRETWHQKFVDWEIAASLESGTAHQRSGILVMPLPLMKNKAVLPERIRDNFVGADNEKSYVIYAGYPTSPDSLRRKIASAHDARSEASREVDNSRLLRGNDSP